MNKISKKKNIKDCIINTFLIICSLLCLCQYFIIGFQRTDGPSMKPTIYQNWILCQKVINNIDIGDIIIAKHNNILICKRVLAGPGDKVAFSENKLFINDIEFNDEHGEFITIGSDLIGHVFNLQDDEYFAVGDNRTESLDCRYYGPIKKTDIVGKCLYIFKK